MIQTKISLEDNQSIFLKQHKNYGFKSRSELVRMALKNMKQELENKKLEKSAKLYRQLYKEDCELQDITNSASKQWPK